MVCRLWILMSNISAIQLAKFKKKLSVSVDLLRADIIKELQNSEHNRHHLVDGQIQNMCNDQLLARLSSLDQPILSALAKKIEKIDATLSNMSIGMFGYCSDCEEPIEDERLNQDPTTQRCLPCESRYNKQKCNHFKL